MQAAGHLLKDRRVRVALGVEDLSLLTAAMQSFKVQRSAKVFFLGCVTRLWMQGATHAT